MAAIRTCCWLRSQLGASRSQMLELDTGCLEVSTDTGQGAGGAREDSDI